MALIAFILLAQSYFGGLPIDGITCDRTEGNVEHIHANLQLYDRGHALTVPGQIGMPDTGGCLYWIHTHSDDGMIHIEAPVKRTFSLGQFFDIWDSDLSWTQAGSMKAPHGKRLSVWVNGTPWHGNSPRDIVLKDHESIVIQNGPPFATPKHPDWSKF